MSQTRRRTELLSSREPGPGLRLKGTGWQLLPEAAVVHPRLGVGVIADVHLGYEWSRGFSGDIVPQHSLDETLTRLDRLLGRVQLERLIVAGDLLESAKPCDRTRCDLARLASWLGDRGVTLVPLRGNHDPPGWPDSITVDGWTISHGHRRVAAKRLIIGHHHPVFRTAELSAPCFLVTDKVVVLPAFSGNAAGKNVSGGWVPDSLPDADYHVVAGLGETLLDFGPAASLSQRLRSARPALHRRS